MEKIKIKLLSFIRENRTEVILLSLLVVICLGLRLYRIDQFMTFLGDEGRDVRIIRRLLSGSLVFIGPQTSIGNMYLGPLYYYLVAPALAISSGNPVGPAIEVALLGTLVVVFTWFVGRFWFDKWTGLIAALLFALSPVAIIYSRSSWNPNPMPLFSLLAVWGIWQTWHQRRYAYLSLVGISLAFALQMHYLGLLLIPTLGLYWLLTLRSIWEDQSQKKLFLKHSKIGLVLFLFLMSPLVLFDLKHNFMNLHAFQTFFGDRQTTVNLNPVRSDRFFPILSQVIGDMVLGRQMQFALPTGIMLILFSFFLLYRLKKRGPILLLFTWLFFGFLGLSVYKQHVYAHYYGLIYPAIFLFLGLVITNLWQLKFVGRLLSLSILSYLLYLAIVFSPVKDNPNNQLARTQEIVGLIMKESADQPFNLGLIAKQNYDESYRYFFEVNHAKMVRGEDKITDQLFAICEDGDSCQPEGNPAYQIAIFGPAKIDKQWNISGVKVYRLTHTIIK